MPALQHDDPTAPTGPGNRAEGDSASKIYEVDEEATTHIQSHASHSYDLPIHHYTSHVEIPDEFYDKISPGRKIIITTLLSFSAFLSPISSTTVLAAVPEVAAEYNTTGTIINITNALYMLSMGISPCFWGPMSQVYGRRWVCITCAVLYLGGSIGTAASPNLAAFFVSRIFTAFQGTAFLVVGSACIGDIYSTPSARQPSAGPAFGPFIGGIIVTFTSWRVIFWLQTALAGVAVISVFILLPETIYHLKSTELEGLPLRRKLHVLWGMTNPWRVIKLFYYPNLLIVSIASSSLLWNMYSLLTPIRYVLNPRFNLVSPIQSGLFYLAPGFGCLIGAFFGGRWADHTVKKWIKIRKGERISEDRLRSCIPFLGMAIPACMLIYGWSVQRGVGGIPLPVIFMFVQGIAQLFCFPSLNTYCLDVMQNQSAEVIAGNYVIRYLFAALGTATVLPAVEAIGVGWFSTISAGYLVLAAGLLMANVRWGRAARDAIDGKRRTARWEREINEGRVLEGGDEKQAAAPSSASP